MISAERVNEIRAWVETRKSIEAEWKNQRRTCPGLDENDMKATQVAIDLLAFLDDTTVESRTPALIAGAYEAAVAYCRRRREGTCGPTVTGPHGEIKTQYHMMGQEQATLDCVREIGRLTPADARAALDALIKDAYKRGRAEATAKKTVLP